MKKIIQKLLLLQCLLFPIITQPMFDLSDHPEAWIEQPKSLQDICTKIISLTLLDIQTYDMEKEENNLRETLEKLPEESQQKIIDEIDIRLDPQWLETNLKSKYQRYSGPNYKKFTFDCLIKKLAIYHRENYLYIKDLESNPSITIKMQQNNIEDVVVSPDATLLAVKSRRNIDIYTLKLPIKRTGTIPNSTPMNLAFSCDQEPKLFATTANSKLLIFSDLHTPNCTFKEYTFPETIDVSSLTVASNNRYIIATSKFFDQKSYIINLENEETTFQPILSIYQARIAPDSSFFVAKIITCDTPMSIIFKKSGRTHLIAGQVIAIKDNTIFTLIRNRYSAINIFNPEGVLQHAYSIHSFWDTPNKNNLYFHDKSSLYTPQPLTNKDFKKIIYRIAHKKAHNQENLSVLKKLAEEPLIKDQANGSIEDIKSFHNSIARTLKKRCKIQQHSHSIKFILGTKELEQPKLTTCLLSNIKKYEECNLPLPYLCLFK